MYAFTTCGLTIIRSNKEKYEKSSTHLTVNKRYYRPQCKQKTNLTDKNKQLQFAEEKKTEKRGIVIYEKKR